MSRHYPSMFATQDPIERQAHLRARSKLGWYTHALVYLCVNTLLLVLSAMSGEPWALFPLLGWGIGLAIHGLKVFVLADARVYERMVRAERHRMEREGSAHTR